MLIVHNACMPKSKWRPSKCKYCPASVENGDVISKRGLCTECGLQRAMTAARNLAEGSGDFHRRWEENPGGFPEGRVSRGVGGRLQKLTPGEQTTSAG